VRLHRVGIGLAAGVLAASGAVAGVVATAGPASAHPAAAPKVVLVNQCTGKGQLRPGTVPLPGCMTSSELIGHAHWTSWRSSAFGRADLEVNNCSPSSSCGPGKYTKYPILVVLWRAKPWAGKTGEDYFTRMTWIYTGKRPHHSAVTHTITLPGAAQ
jgi:hypothetical protein